MTLMSLRKILSAFNEGRAKGEELKRVFNRKPKPIIPKTDSNKNPQPTIAAADLYFPPQHLDAARETAIELYSGRVYVETVQHPDRQLEKTPHHQVLKTDGTLIKSPGELIAFHYGIYH